MRRKGIAMRQLLKAFLADPVKLCDGAGMNRSASVFVRGSPLGFYTATDIQHPLIRGGYGFRTLAQLLADLIGDIPDILFVLQLMIQTGPEIHGNGPDLNLDPQVLFFF